MCAYLFLSFLWVYACVCVCMCMIVCVFVYVLVCIHMNECVFMCIIVCVHVLYCMFFACTYAWLCVHVCVCVWTCGGQKLTANVFLDHASFCFWDRVFHWTQSLTIWLDWLASKLLGSTISASQSCGYSHRPTTPSFRSELCLSYCASLSLSLSLSSEENMHIHAGN